LEQIDYLFIRGSSAWKDTGSDDMDGSWTDKAITTQTQAIGQKKAQW
jgi:hypothetical protein